MEEVKRGGKKHASGVGKAEVKVTKQGRDTCRGPTVKGAVNLRRAIITVGGGINEEAEVKTRKTAKGKSTANLTRSPKIRENPKKIKRKISYEASAKRKATRDLTGPHIKTSY
ncbi:hypothetical protein Salat_2134500 [Sesamum alatum]|uniref:Uncharacterized protein n=1 Tax=Sesamum alatum TaxID=300844 RepID=A0AAE1Y1C4_9LAMI|nr:hypothetical protein Salat_2134500 [Sesamum alatum]